MSKVILKDVCVEFSKYTMRGKRGLVSNALGAGLQRKNFFALENINVELNKGDRVALLGQNGSGKSTLLRVLAGVLPPTSGELIVEGAVFPALNPAAGVMPKATCMQNIVLQGLANKLTGSDLDDYISAVVDFADLGDFINSPFEALSKGMKSRLNVATLYGLEPQLLFMDEWIGAADKKVLNKGKGLMSKLVNGSDIFVLASHREGIVSAHCNRALVISDAKIVFDGDVETALEM